MIPLGSGASAALVGVAAMIVVGWGAWLSIGSSRNGPDWAHSVLVRWRRLPWLAAAVGVVLAVVVAPVWVGVSVVYIGAVTGWLMRTVRRSLDRVRLVYGGFDAPAATSASVSTRAVTWLLVGSVVLAGVAVWDIAARGWSGLFGLVLAGCLGGVGLVLRRSG